MSPIPEINYFSPKMFTGLEGNIFLDTIKTLENLGLNSESVTTEPPGKEIIITNSIFRDNCYEKANNICIPKAFLIRGKDVEQNFNEILDLNLIPKRVESIKNNKTLEAIFGIKLYFDETTQIISITKEGEKSINLQHDGLWNPINTNNRHAILALCIAPDKLWSSIRKNGFIFGKLYGREYDLPWVVKRLSINLPYTKYSNHKIDSNKDGKLNEFSIYYLSEMKPLLHPIGLFIDNRNHKF